MLFSKKLYVAAPVSGICDSVSESTDSVFSEKVLGDGVVIQTQSTTAVSPVSGKIVQIAHTKHAFSIESNDGVEVLVHLGVDTVKLSGEGFKCHKKVGDSVKPGDTIMDMDLDFIKSRGFSTEVLCIVLNHDEFHSFNVTKGQVESGKSPVITLSK